MLGFRSETTGWGVRPRRKLALHTLMIGKVYVGSLPRRKRGADKYRPMFGTIAVHVAKKAARQREFLTAKEFFSAPIQKPKPGE